MFKKLNLIVVLLSLVMGISFTSCKRDPQINPPAKVFAPPIEITNSIAPNPCNVSLTITTNSSSNQTVKMIDMLGRVRVNLTINGTTVINTDSLQAGAYFLSIANSTGTKTNKILVIH